MGETRAADIVGTLKEWLPSCMSKMSSFVYIHVMIRINFIWGDIDAFGKLSSFKTRLQGSNAASDLFKPPGKLIQSYTSRKREFEIWRGEMTDPAVRLLLERMQIFVSFFIEAGTPLELDDQDWTLARWQVFLVSVTLYI